ncbi:hypothetical protein ABZ135_16250 [Streptomyces sp. NPDC006339]|uniref:hypothetical protein n=1 Tax=Streptomyces sp. NPDC006339 TaxID=3156755 RepID=UPI0033BA024D
MAVLLSAAISVGPVVPTPLAPLLLRAAAASISLSPASGPPGTDVVVTGSGFDGCGKVTITFDGGHAVAGTANLPLISGEIRVPQDATPGPHTIAALCKPHVDTGGDTFYGQAVFTVTGVGGDGDGDTGGTTDETAGITLDPGTVRPGGSFTVDGSGFGRCSTDDVELYVEDQRVLDYRIDVGAETGTFSEQVTVPDAADPGTYTVRAVCVGPDVFAEAPLVVEGTAHGEPVLTLDLAESAPGETVRAAGTGFACPAVDLLWDGDEPPLGTAETREDRSFDAVEITVPADAEPGAHTVRAQCAEDPERYDEAAYEVTDPATTRGTTTGGTETGGTETGGTGTGGTETGGTETGGTGTGGTETGGTTGGGGSGTGMPVALVVGSTGGIALALALGALAYFGRLPYRGPRWVRTHVRATLRPAAGRSVLTEHRAPGEPPSHTTRLDPHPDPGRQTIEEQEEGR